MKLLHISTWWTISGNIPECKEVEEIAKIFLDSIDIWKYIVYSMKAPVEYNLVTVCHKDSREISILDRKKMVDEIVKNYNIWTKLFLITHGTYTMPETWIYILENLPKEILDQVSIVITWAMYPRNILGSDAPLNIWASISSLLNTEKPLWVKICMHWKNREPSKVEKDVWKLLFHNKI